MMKKQSDMSDRNGLDLDIWGDGSKTNSTPIPEEWDHHRGTEDTEKSVMVSVNEPPKSCGRTLHADCRCS